MHVIVLGGGVIGVCSAWYLAAAGHRVTVIDRQPAVAMETSHANAGQVSPGYSAPWAAPGVPLKALNGYAKARPTSYFSKSLARPCNAALVWQMLRQCNSNAYLQNKGNMVLLAEYSRDCLAALRAELSLCYDHRTQGTLQLFRIKNSCVQHSGI